LAGALTQDSWDDAFTLSVRLLIIRNVLQRMTIFTTFPRSKQMIKNFLADESGIETMEYAIIAAIVAAVAILVYGAGWGQALRTKLLGAANVSTNVGL